MRRIKVILLIAVSILLLLPACALPPGIMGTRLLTLDGHFMFDQYYDYGYQAWYLNADGTYERIGKDWDPVAGGYVQAWGTTGTYTYDRATYLLTISPLQGWEWGGGEGYVDIDALFRDGSPDLESWSMTRTFTYYFTDNGMFEAYMAQPNGSWTFTEYNISKMTEAGVESEEYSTYTKTYSISSTEIAFTELQTEKDWEDTVVVNDWRYREAGEIRRTAPTGTAWETGSTVTFYYGPETRVDETWNSVTEDWDIMWDGSDPTSNWNRTFVHLGDFIMRVDPASSKDLF